MKSSPVAEVRTRATPLFLWSAGVAMKTAVALTVLGCGPPVTPPEPRHALAPSDPPTRASIELRGPWWFRRAPARGAEGNAYGSDTDVWMPATVPGCVHTDLLANKKIEDPFYAQNE